MAGDVWYRIFGSHSSCCGIHVLTAVRNPREDPNTQSLSYYGDGFPDMPPNFSWRASEFDPFKWDEAIDAVPRQPYNVGWDYRFRTTNPKVGMQLLQFVKLDHEVPEGFTVLTENSHGKLIGRVV